MIRMPMAGCKAFTMPLVVNKPHFRIAPTPSGFLHPGNLFNFLLTQQLCIALGGTLRLRIDDIDQTRSRTTYIDAIFFALEAIDIAWQEGPKNTDDFVNNHSQLQRIELYAHYLSLLASSNWVYACTCSRRALAVPIGTGTAGQCQCVQQHLPLQTPEAAWRLKVPAQTIVAFIDGFMGPQHYALGSSMGPFVVRKKDGLPAYQLASVVDDYHYGVTHIVRGYDLLPSTSAQCFLAQALKLPNFEAVQYFHHPLLTNSNGQKLSKSAGNSAIKSLPSAAALKATKALLMPLVQQALNQVFPTASGPQ
ncbi:MAG: hypothetical protein EAY75_16355 [Bacteroidetes bacterium]|nr:MAG: hypothetical protein EAY75_16355 [Bacteroidota bacterium]